jgi:hypothetical protein
MELPMSLEVQTLTRGRETEYSDFLKSIEHAMMYYSLSYRNFLRNVLKDSVDAYFIAYRQGEIIGVLPSFMKINDTYGNVLNALPFYGSNGGIIVSENGNNSLEVKKKLLESLYDYTAVNSVVACTIISNPLDMDVNFYKENTAFTFKDERIGQVTELPRSFKDSDDIKQQLMDKFHQKTRNAIRKALKSHIMVTHSGSLEGMKALAKLHKDNMEAIGGMAKPWPIFEAIYKNFIYDSEYRVYTAEKDGRIIAALLVIFFNKTVEYFIPATKQQYRIYQVMSLLCFQAMQDATQKGCRWWNWGGTWLSQTGVYHFKKRWGTLNIPYYYYIKVFDSKILTIDKKVIIEQYPYYYVIPFDKIKSQQ